MFFGNFSEITQNIVSTLENKIPDDSQLEQTQWTETEAEVINLGQEFWVDWHAVRLSTVVTINHRVLHKTSLYVTEMKTSLSSSWSDGTSKAYIYMPAPIS